MLFNWTPQKRPRLFAELVSPFATTLPVAKRVPFFMLYQHYVKIDQNEWKVSFSEFGSTSLLKTQGMIELAKNAKTLISGSCLEGKKCVTNCCASFSCCSSWWSHCWKLRFPSLNLERSSSSITFWALLRKQKHSAWTAKSSLIRKLEIFSGNFTK